MAMLRLRRIWMAIRASSAERSIWGRMNTKAWAPAILQCSSRWTLCPMGTPGISGIRRSLFHGANLCHQESRNGRVTGIGNYPRWSGCHDVRDRCAGCNQSGERERQRPSALPILRRVQAVIPGRFILPAAIPMKIHSISAWSAPDCPTAIPIRIGCMGNRQRI